MQTVQIFSKSQIGKFKNKNQDTCFYAVNKHKQVLVAIADGVSAYSHSQIASQILCQILKNQFVNADFTNEKMILP